MTGFREARGEEALPQGGLGADQARGNAGGVRDRILSAPRHVRRRGDQPPASPVLDRQAAELRIFHPDGAMVASVTPFFAPSLHWAWDGDRHLWAAFGGDLRIEGDLVGGDTKPAFARFWVDEAGRLWVDPARAEGAPRSVEVWSGEGAFLGAIPVEEGFMTYNPRPVIRDRQLYAIVRDDLDVPFVVRYRGQNHRLR